MSTPICFHSYGACDIGTAPNQTINDLPPAATSSIGGDPSERGVLVPEKVTLVLNIRTALLSEGLIGQVRSAF